MGNVVVNNLGKKYKRYKNHWTRLAELVTRERCVMHEERWALRGVSFNVNSGGALGIVGQNGSGKSTLLKMLTGTTKASEGSIKTEGSIAALLELGMGFHPDFTGRENAIMACKMAGFDNDQINSFLPEIEEFSELHDYMDEPLRVYSSGMQMRLAFSAATALRPDIFIVDEALSVGDAYFQHKCINRIRNFKESGTTLLFVSHDMNAVKVLCDHAILLDKGKLIDYGAPSEIIDFYQNMVLKEIHRGKEELIIERKKEKFKNLASKNSKVAPIQSESGAKTGEVELLSCNIYNNESEQISYITSENIVKIVFKIIALTGINEPHYGVILRDRLGQSVFETNTYCMKQRTKAVRKDQIVKITYEFLCNLYPGSYSISIGVAQTGIGIGSFEEYLLLIHDVEILKVIQNDNSIQYSGITNLKPRVIVEECS